GSTLEARVAASIGGKGERFIDEQLARAGLNAGGHGHQREIGLALSGAHAGKQQRQDRQMRQAEVTSHSCAPLFLSGFMHAHSLVAEIVTSASGGVLNLPTLSSKGRTTRVGQPQKQMPCPSARTLVLARDDSLGVLILLNDNRFRALALP